MPDQIQMSVAQAKRNRLIYLFATAIVFLVFGLIYAWSIFASPIGEAYGWAKGELQTTFNIALVCFCLAGAVASSVNKALGPKLTLIVAGVCMCLGFLGVALFGAKSIVAIWISYGVLCGAGCGLGYLIALSLVNSWWGDRVGFSSGIMMMGFSFGSLILGSLANVLINSIGLKPVFIILAVVAIVFSLILAFLLKPAPAYINQLIPPANAGKVDESSYENDNILKSKDFFIYLCWAIFIIAAGITLIGGSKQCALAVNISEGTATLIVGLVSTMTGVARPIFGTICDKLSLKSSMLISGILNVAGAGLIVVTFAGGPSVLFIVGALAMGLGYGAIPVNASSFARERFGAKNYAKNLGIVNLSAAVGSFLSMGLIAIASPDGSSTYLSVWIVVAVAACIGLLGGILFACLYHRPGTQK